MTFAILQTETYEHAGTKRLIHDPEIITKGVFMWPLINQIRSWLGEQSHEWIKYFSPFSNSATVQYTKSGYCITRSLIKIGEERE